MEIYRPKPENKTFTKEAFNARKSINLDIFKILKKLDKKGWSDDQAEYLINQSIAQIRCFECLNLKDKEIIKTLKKDKYYENP